MQKRVLFSKKLRKSFQLNKSGSINQKLNALRRNRPDNRTQNNESRILQRRIKGIPRRKSFSFNKHRQLQLLRIDEGFVKTWHWNITMKGWVQVLRPMRIG